MMTSICDADLTPPPKLPKLECIIHCTDDDDQLVAPQSLDSRETLFNAAKIRKHVPLLEVVKTVSLGQTPQIFYHRKCSSYFTSKGSLNRILAQHQDSTRNTSEIKKSR